MKGSFWLPFVPAFLAVSGFYLATFYPGLVEDPPQTGSVIASVSHPHFYSRAFSPLYLLIGQIGKILPGENLAFYGNLFSLCLGLGAVGLLYIVVRKLTLRIIPALFAALSLGLSSLFWPFSVVANFYIPFCFFSYLLLMLLLFDSSLFWWGFLGGILISTLPSGLAMIVPLLTAVFIRKHFSGWKDVFNIVGGLCLGLFPLLVASLFFNFSWQSYFEALRFLDSSLYQNFLNLLALFAEVPWGYVFLFFVGILWGGESVKRKVFLSYLFSFLPLALFFPLPQSKGLFLPFWGAFFAFSAWGLAALLDLLNLFQQTKIGVAWENKLFVLIFKLKQQVALLKALFAGVLVVFVGLLIVWDIDARYETAARSGEDLLIYMERATPVLVPQTLVLVEEQLYLSTLQYLKACNGYGDVVITSTSLPYDEEEQDRVRSNFPSLVMASLDFVRGSKGEEVLQAFVADNLDNWGIYLALRPALGDQQGSWGEFTLIPEGPLYRIQDRD
ncbi:MAG: hypothetical protein ACOC4Z_02070 [Patescibacteria group bacterium]